MKKNDKFARFMMPISVIAIVGFVFYVIVMPSITRPPSEDDVFNFRVTSDNSSNVSYSVLITITNESNVEIFNLSIIIQPNSRSELYRGKLSEREYTVKVIVDGNWTDSITHRPEAFSRPVPYEMVTLGLHPQGHKLSIEKDSVNFLVVAGNNYNISYSVRIIVTNEKNTEIFDRSFIIKPNTFNELYRSNLPEQEYTVKVIVDGDWTDSITHRPETVSRPTPYSWVSFNLRPQDHSLSVKYIV